MVGNTLPDRLVHQPKAMLVLSLNYGAPRGKKKFKKNRRLSICHERRDKSWLREKEKKLSRLSFTAYLILALLKFREKEIERERGGEREREREGGGGERERQTDR